MDSMRKLDVPQQDPNRTQSEKPFCKNSEDGPLSLSDLTLHRLGNALLLRCHFAP